MGKRLLLVAIVPIHERQGWHIGDVPEPKVSEYPVPIFIVRCFNLSILTVSPILRSVDP
jgi:hypothetical protein